MKKVLIGILVLAVLAGGAYLIVTQVLPVSSEEQVTPEVTEALTGTLKPGMAADVVVLSGDIETTAPAEIAAMSVALTVAGGRITWQD